MKESLYRLAVALLLALVGVGQLAPSVAGASGFVNFETPQVHPIDLSPDRSLLAVVNTADHRLLLFDVADGRPKLRGAVPVGLDPVSARFLGNDEVWVVNQLSDSVSVVDVPTLRVRATLQTLDEPADVVFAGSPARAFVSCSAVDKVLVFDPANPAKAPRTVKIGAQEPRALAVSPNGNKVYAAIFESGNRSTVLGGGIDVERIESFTTLPKNVVSDADGPYGGQNPPPNAGTGFNPPIAPNLPPPPPVALIVKRRAGRWLDDNGGDWTEFVSGSRSGRSKRPRGWDVIDRDVAEIDARTLKVKYIEGLMNINMALAVNPASGAVTVVGTDATNEIRFEPLLNGVFLRVLVALEGGGRPGAVLDLNPHLDYSTSTLPKDERKRAIGDPRGIVWNDEGTRGWISGMGSNNVVEIDAAGDRVGAPIAVGQGPTGVAYDDQLDVLYVLNRFGASVSVVDVDTGRQTQRVKFFDPTPKAIRKGRPHFYDTHKTSGLGHVSCASCHVDARTDRLSWDLGVPNGEMIPIENRNTFFDADVATEWHPMKGPMTTQTMQDIIGKEPHHWRGDRRGLEEFNDAFVGLLGDDKKLSKRQMRQFEKFLATIHFPPNPFRELDNSMPRRLQLDGHVRNGRFGPAGRPLPDGNPIRGLNLFRTRGLDSGIQCVECHSLPTGAGSNQAPIGLGQFEPIPRGPNGEANLALIGEDASEQLGFKIPHLRNSYDKVGMDLTKKKSPSGFGFFHDGTIDSLARFVGSEIFDVVSDQEIADLVALMLVFSGSDFDVQPGDPPGVESQDAHAAVGRQVTISAAGQESALLQDLVDLAAAGRVDLIARGRRAGAPESWILRSADGLFHAGGQPGLALADLRSLAAPGAELTFTVVPRGSADLIAGKRLELRRTRERTRERRRIRQLAEPTAVDVSRR